MKAMILAAGRGERLRPHTDTTPKPLLPAGGKPLVVHLLRALAAAGFRDIVLNLAHLGEQIEQALGDGSRFGLDIRYSWEPEGALETAGGIARALPLLGSKPFLVINGDIATDFAFAELRTEPAGLAHLILVPNPPHKPSGDFWLEGRHACVTGEGPGYTFSGIGVYRPALFAGVPNAPTRLAPLLREAMAQGQITAQVHRGHWLDIGTPERLRQVDDFYSRRFI